MFIGGVLIRRFDGFRRLCHYAAEEFHLDLNVPDEDLLVVNRVLASLGGPPAAAQAQGSFRGDGLALLLLFLLTQEYPCRIGLIGPGESVMGRLKALTHLLGHAVWPMISGAEEPLDFQEVVKEIGPAGTQLRPVFAYDANGEPTAMQRSGAASALRTGADGGPYTLAVLLGEHPGPAPLAHPTELRPAVLVVTL